MPPVTEEPNLQLAPHDRDELKRILRERLQGYEVWAFGSRAKGMAKPYSDLDLVIVSPQPVPLATMADLRDAFDESDLTIKVDLVDWAATNDRFREIIKSSSVILQSTHPASS